MSLSRRTVALLGIGALLLMATGAAAPAAATSQTGPSRTTTYTIPGNHYSIIGKPAVEKLAQQLKACIAERDEVEQAVPQFI